jgi:hypothetical protein
MADLTEHPAVFNPNKRPISPKFAMGERNADIIRQGYPHRIPATTRGVVVLYQL